MVIALILVGFALLSFILFCLARASTEYDRRLDDAEQEKFIREYWKTHSREQ